MDSFCELCRTSLKFFEVNFNLLLLVIRLFAVSLLDSEIKELINFLLQNGCQIIFYQSKTVRKILYGSRSNLFTISARCSIGFNKS